MDEGEKDCLLCSNESACKSHQKKDENDSRKQESDTNLVDGQKVHLPTHNEPKTHECPTCHKILCNRFSLRDHLKLHTGQKDFSCHLCSKKFYRGHELKKHLKRHTGLTDFICNICSKGFYEKCNLIYHMKIHSQVKEFKCHICDNEFHLEFNMMIHMKTHPECKELKCHLCNKAFFQKSQLEKHLNKAHTPRNEIKCELCGKELMHSLALIKHIEVCSKLVPNVKSVPCAKLSEFRCHHCGREYTKKFHLDQHLLTHKDQMIIVNSSTITEEEDVITMEFDPEKDPLAIEDEIPPVVKEECPDSNLLEETQSVYKSGDFIGSEFSVKLESNVEDKDFVKNHCKSGDVKHEIVKEEEYIDCDH